VRRRTRNLLRTGFGILTLLCAGYAYVLWHYGAAGSGSAMVRAVRAYEFSLAGALLFGTCFLLSLSNGEKR
jgi:hypothetical protein